MKCNKFRVEQLRNEEWFQFYTEFKNLVEQHTAPMLEIDVLFTNFLSLYADADEALVIIRKSATTEQISDADITRDGTFRGFVNAVKSAHSHFNAEKRELAKRVQISIKNEPFVKRLYDRGILYTIEDYNEEDYYLSLGGEMIKKDKQEKPQSNLIDDKQTKYYKCYNYQSYNGDVNYRKDLNVKIIFGKK